MKIKKLSSVLVFLGLSLVAFGQKYIPEDDLYYQPGDENPIIEQKKQEKAVSPKPEPVEVSKAVPSAAQTDYDRAVDAYNRRYSSSTVADTTSSATLGESTQIAQDRESIAGIDTIDTDYDYNGYYLNGFEGSQSDLEYAERIRRFHNPKFTIHISDPAYTDIYFLNPSDWNVYIDNSYAYVTPTWTNPWYWNYMWAPYSYSSLSWRWNFGFGSWGFYWGYGYPGWGYNPYWGWAGPAWYPHWGWGGHHHYPGYYPGHRPGWNNGRDIRYSNGGRTIYGNYGSSNRYSGGSVSTRPSSTGNKYTSGSSSSRQPIMRETNSNRGRTRIGTSSGNSTYSRPSGTTTRSSSYRSGSSSRTSSGSSSRVRTSNGGRSTYTPSTSTRRSSGSSYSPMPSSSRSSGSSGSVGRSSGGSRGRTR